MKPTYNMEIANRLAEIRRQHGLSQEELAERLGLSRQAVSKWERAESQPDMGNLIALADVYGTTIDEIVCRSDGAAKGDSMQGADGGAGTESPSAWENAGVSGSPRVGGSGQPERVASAPDASGASPTFDEAAAPAYPPPTGRPVDPFDGTYDPYGDPNQPVYAEMPTTPKKRRVNPIMAFPYPIAVVIIYLVLGFAFNLWHPGWFLFLTIPFYYWAAAVIGNDPNYLESQGDISRQRR